MPRCADVVHLAFLGPALAGPFSCWSDGNAFRGKWMSGLGMIMILEAARRVRLGANARPLLEHNE